MKICTVLGARPNFIKAGVVSEALRLASPDVEEILIHTGQHYDYEMSRLQFEQLGLATPKYNLEVGSGSHGVQTARMLERVEEVLIAEKPDKVIVYGDTNSTLAGALAAAKLHIPIAHVEAGLRSFNRKMPEEVNRVLVDHISDHLYAPSEIAMGHLAKEGLSGEKAIFSGDVMLDVSLKFREKILKHPHLIQKLDLEAGNYYLASVHRAENTDDPAKLGRIFEALAQVATSGNVKRQVVMPLHPRTRALVEGREEFLGWQERILLLPAVGYFEMLELEANSAAIITDSGGVQKEAFFLSKPCAILRDETEWTELLDLGWATLIDVSGSVANIVASMGDAFKRSGRAAAPFGNGHAAAIIAKDVLKRT